MIPLQQHPEGTIIPVRAQPGARRNAVVGQQGGMLKVCVTQSPERGKANKAVVEVLAKAMGLRKSQVALVSGGTSAQKRFLIRGVSPEELGRRIDPLLSGD